MEHLTDQQAHAVYDVLVNEAGASPHPSDRYSFVVYMSEPDGWVKEYRFQGDLGFGGKCRLNNNHDGLPYVDCYPEDETPARRAIIDRTNAALRELFAKEGEGE